MTNIINTTSWQRVPPNGAASTTWTLSAGTTTVQSGAVDSANAKSVLFVVALGAVSASGTGTITVQQSNDLSGSPDDYTAVQGVSATYADSDGGTILLVEIVRPQKRYLRLNIARATANSAIDGVFAVRVNPRAAPPALHATVKSATVAASPNE